MAHLAHGGSTPEMHTPAHSPDPFASPAPSQNGHAASPFDDPPASHGPIMDPAPVMDPDSTPRRAPVPLQPAPERPVLHAIASYMDPDDPGTARAGPPPPKPFDIPPPRTPPPKVATPQAERQPSRLREEHLEEEKPRWWTDWLCGCGPSKESDDQV